MARKRALAEPEALEVKQVKDKHVGKWSNKDLIERATKLAKNRELVRAAAKWCLDGSDVRSADPSPASVEFEHV